jgi:beta-phosphoglucomutase-like phosphatase (HAD superfamily)
MTNVNHKKNKALIFDFNGTLLWDTPLHNKAWDIFLVQHRIDLSDEEKTHVIHGKANNDIFKAIFNKEFDPPVLKKLSEEKESIYQDLCLETNIQLADGATELFDFCKSNAIPFAIATSSYKQNIDFYIKRFGLLKWFDEERIIFNDGTIRSKPDPEIFEIAIRKLNCRPENVVIFEDSIAGIKAAIAAKAGEIIIVNSNNDNYDGYGFQVINSLRDASNMGALAELRRKT